MPKDVQLKNLDTFGEIYYLIAKGRWDVFIPSDHIQRAAAPPFEFIQYRGDTPSLLGYVEYAFRFFADRCPDQSWCAFMFHLSNPFNLRRAARALSVSLY